MTSPAVRLTAVVLFALMAQSCTVQCDCQNSSISCPNAALRAGNTVEVGLFDGSGIVQSISGCIGDCTVQSVDWSSSNPAVAVIAQTSQNAATVRAVGVGTANIAAKVTTSRGSSFARQSGPGVGPEYCAIVVSP